MYNKAISIIWALMGYIDVVTWLVTWNEKSCEDGWIVNPRLEKTLSYRWLSSIDGPIMKQWTEKSFRPFYKSQALQ